MLGHETPLKREEPVRGTLWREMTRTLAAFIVAFTLTACGDYDLAESDPKGAEACSLLADALRNKDDRPAALLDSFASGEAASKAKTPTIREAVVDVAGSLKADPVKMVAACRTAGVTMPDAQ